MQHIGVDITNDSLFKIKSSDINFANILAKVWSNSSKEEYPWLWGVDAYGLTLLNVLQSQFFIDELQRFKASVHDKEIQNIVEQLISFINENLKDLNYVKFTGD